MSQEPQTLIGKSEQATPGKRDIPCQDAQHLLHVLSARVEEKLEFQSEKGMSLIGLCRTQLGSSGSLPTSIADVCSVRSIPHFSAF